MSEYHVLIVGGGPSGSSLAFRLASRGVKVAVFDRRIDGWPPKPCGGGLDGAFFENVPSQMSVEAVVEDRIEEMWIRSTRTGREKSYPMPGRMWMTQRHQLDAHLLRQAAEAGADVFHGTTASSFTDHGDSWKVEAVDTEEQQKARQGKRQPLRQEFRGKFLVGADGAYSQVARTLQFKLEQVLYQVAEWDVRDPDAVAQWQHKTLIEPSISPISYSWIFPKADHVNIGYGTPRRMASQVHGGTQAFAYRKGLGHTKDARKKAHVIPFTQSGEVARDKVLLVGDAAGAVDPGTGGGIGWGMNTAKIAFYSIMHHLDGNFFFGTQNYQEWFDAWLLARFREAEALRNSLLFYYAITGKEHPQLFHDLIRVVGGDYTYEKWRQEHPRWHRWGRLLQPLVDRLSR